MTSVDAADVIVDLLSRGHRVRFQVRGDSMHPIVRGEDYLHVEPVELSSIACGDVVLTLAERGLTAHRVVAISGETIVTRGDNAPAPDPPIVPSRILGRVTHAEREGRCARVERLTPLRLLVRRWAMRIRARLGRES